MRKYYYRLNNNLNDAINEYKDLLKKSNNLKFVITLNDEDFLEDENSYKSILNILKQNNIEPHNIVVAIKPTKRNYEQEEWSKIVEISNKLTDKGIQFGFEDQDKIFNIQQIQNANDKIITTSNGINKLKLSPYEKLLMSYFTVTSRKYVSEDVQKDHPADSRSIYGVLNSKKIVCVGFSEWLKNILLELDDANIKVFSNEVSCSRDNKTINGYHENLIIYIKDEKYGIDGYYYLDPTWDHARDNTFVPRLTYFMVPLKDIEKIKFHIRSFRNSGLPYEPPKTISKPRAKKKAQNTYSIGREFKPNISFSSDKFDFNKEFLRDLFISNPQLLEKIKDKLYENKLLDCFAEEEKYKQRRELLEEMKKVVETTGIDLISIKEKFELRVIIDKCCKSGNIDKFIEFEQSLKTNYSNKNQTYVKDFVEYCKYFISKDFFISELNNNIEFFKMLDKTNPLLLEYQAILDQLKSGNNETWEQLNNNATKILGKLEIKLTDSPELEQYLKTINENDVEMISKLIINNSINNKILKQEDSNQVEDIISNMKSRMKDCTTQTTIIEDELRSNNEKIDSIKRDINKTGEISLDIAISRVINHDGCKQIIEEYLKENSSAIDLSMLSEAMSHILQKTKNIENDQIYDYVKRVIAYNCDQILSNFDSSATNSFVQYAITYNNQENIQT